MNKLTGIIISTAICMANTATASANETLAQSLCAGYGKNGATNYWGGNTNAHLSAAVKLSAEQLNGTEIVALNFTIDPAAKMNDCLIFIKSSLDRDENLYEQEFSPVAGRNLVWLDYPFAITTANELYIGYEMTCNGETIGYTTVSSKGDDADCVRNGFGGWSRLSEITGAPVELSLSAILSGGDYSALPANGLELSADATPDIVKADTPFNVTATVTNTGTVTLKELTMTYSVDGVKTGTPITLETSMLNYGSCDITVPVAVEEGPHNVTVEVAGPDGQAQSHSFTVDAYQRAYEKLPLVELFTSQYCTNCPSGEETLEKVLHNYREPVVCISHHSGFAADNFTIDASDELATAMGVTTAPSMMLNRTPHVVAGRESLVFHPAYSNVSQYEGFRRNGTLIGTATEATYHTPDNIIAVKVTVEKDAHFTDPAPRLNVIVCEDNVTDFQLDKGATHVAFIHSHAPRVFLTPVEGVEVEFDAEGRALYEFKAELPAIKTGMDPVEGRCNPENLNVVAFLGSNTAALKESKVINAAVSAVEISNESGIEHVESDRNTVIVSVIPGGFVSMIASEGQAEIYNMSGTKVAKLNGGETVRLSNGLYIVKSLGCGLTQKIAVNG